MWDRLPADIEEAEETFLADPKLLAESHRRCALAGLSRDIPRPRDALAGAPLQAFLNRHRGIGTVARKLFAETAGHLPDKRTVLILTDGSARIVEMHASPQVAGGCRGRGVCAGASLAEESAGTNAVALALKSGRPVALRGEQHYCRLFRDWFCAAAPVIGVNAHRKVDHLKGSC